MFPSSKGALKSIPCPALRSNKSCDLPNCVFDHDFSALKRRSTSGSRRDTTSGTDTAKPVIPSKRIRVDLSDYKNPVQGTQLDQPKQSSANSGTGSVVAPGTSPEESIRPAILTKSKLHSAQVSSEPLADSSKLVPRHVVPFDPAPIPQRLKMLRVVHDTLAKCNIKTSTPIKDAIDLEYDVALKSSNVTYPVNLRRLVAEIRSGRYEKREEIALAEARMKTVKEDECLKKLVLSKELLLQRNYVLDENIVVKRLDSDFKTHCARCNSDFSVSKNNATTCQFHLLRREYDHTKKKRSDIFPCCSQPLGETNGCEKRTFHVFKLTDPQYLAGVIPFVKTPTSETDASSSLFAAGLDCEMGYTTLGMELIRVTIVDWTTKKTVLDQHVLPYGEVLDLNTRFSGVHSLEEPLVHGDGTTSMALSFTEARELIFKYICASTIMIGHGLENDLIAMRLIHHRIVDTAILYPSLRESRTYSLKQLTFSYLGRTIQTGEHDSSEDAISAMDIVRENLKKVMA